MLRDAPRPRQPNPATVSYLRSLPLDVNVANEEIAHFLEQQDSTEFPQSLAAALSALTEVTHEFASLAGDEHAAESLEAIIRIVAPVSTTAARRLLGSISGYVIHLATHRYGSHVLQTILQNLNRSSMLKEPFQDLACHEHAPSMDDAADGIKTERTGVETGASLTGAVVALLEELTPHAAELAEHMCGTHVLRSLICAMCGVELRMSPRFDSSRRGKTKDKKKKKKGRKGSAIQGERNAASNARMMYSANCRVDCNSERARSCVKRFCASLTGDDSITQDPGQLQDLVCQSSGGPLLSILLRALTYRDSPNKEKWTEQLEAWEERLILQQHVGAVRPEPTLQSESEGETITKGVLCWPKSASDVVYTLAGDPMGSHCLETILKICTNEFHTKMIQTAGWDSSTTLSEYVEQDSSCYIVQSLLTTLRGRDQAASVLENLDALVRNGSVLVPAQRQRSVLWRMIEASATHKVYQAELVKSIVAGVGASGCFRSVQSMEDCIPFFLDAEHEDARVRLNVAGTRCVHQLLRFEPQHCRGVLSGILRLPVDTLESLMKDGLGSRCIIDGILEGPSNDSFNKSRNKLTNLLLDRWVSVATDRVGHHSVLKLFMNLKDDSHLEVLVEELWKGKKRLYGNSMGRQIIKSCFVQEYETMGPSKWKMYVRNAISKDSWVNEIATVDKQQQHKRQQKNEEQQLQGSKRSKVQSISSIVATIGAPATR